MLCAKGMISPVPGPPSGATPRRPRGWAAQPARGGRICASLTACHVQMCAFTCAVAADRRCAASAAGPGSAAGPAAAAAVSRASFWVGVSVHSVEPGVLAGPTPRVLKAVTLTCARCNKHGMCNQLNLIHSTHEMISARMLKQLKRPQSQWPSRHRCWQHFAAKECVIAPECRGSRLGTGRTS